MEGNQKLVGRKRKLSFRKRKLSFRKRKLSFRNRKLPFRKRNYTVRSKNYRSLQLQELDAKVGSASRTGTPSFARYTFTSPTVYCPK
jgi:hypothetical protein